MKRPSFQFYPADWRKDVELRSCAVDARGLWIDLLCIAHECEPYGHLVLNGKPMTAANIAGQIGGMTAAQVQRLIGVLVENGVARKLDDGTIYSKRMVEDERVRNARADGGKAGADHGFKGAEHGSKGGRPKGNKGGSKTPLALDGKPPPSSSSASSSSASPGDMSVASQPRVTRADPEIDCPHGELVRLFTEYLPDLPKPRAELMSDGRKRSTAARWRWVITARREDGRRYAEDKATAIEWFGNFFDKVAASEFLTGRNGKFKASFDWLMAEKNFNKVIEGNYDNKESA